MQRGRKARWTDSSCGKILKRRKCRGSFDEGIRQQQRGGGERTRRITSCCTGDARRWEEEERGKRVFMAFPASMGVPCGRSVDHSQGPNSEIETRGGSLFEVRKGTIFDEMQDFFDARHSTDAALGETVPEYDSYHMREFPPSSTNDDPRTDEFALLIQKYRSLLHLSRNVSQRRQ